MKTVVINLYGGPGAGKSTLASALFVLLKREGEQVELVREYAKSWAYEQKHIDTLMKQTYILAKQAQRESSLYGKVKYIITDCPLALSGYYCQKYLGTPAMSVLMLEFLREAAEQDVEHVYFQVPRKKDYNPNGRYQTEEEAKEIDREQGTYFSNFFDPIKLQGTESQLAYEIMHHLKLRELHEPSP
jgi:energy-coupling factor transporter ATP-binding protein EcfA2